LSRHCVPGLVEQLPSELARAKGIDVHPVLLMSALFGSMSSGTSLVGTRADTAFDGHR
jgi:hypothetical protein